MTPLDVECIHPFCLAQKQEACGLFDITTGGRAPFLIDGKPDYHSERWASMYWDVPDAIKVDKAIIDRAAEDLV